MKLHRPVDGIFSQCEPVPTDRLKDRSEFPDATEFAIYQAKVFYEGFSDNAAAAAVLEERLKADKGSSDLYLALAEVYSRDETKTKRAMEACQKGLELDPKSDYGHTIKARLHFSKGEAVECYLAAQEALKISLDNYEALVYHGSLGFAIAHRTRNVEEMKNHIENLEIALSYFPKSKRLERILIEDRQILEGFE